MVIFLMSNLGKLLSEKFGYEQRKDSIDPATDEPVVNDNGDVLKVTYIEEYFWEYCSLRNKRRLAF